MTFPSQSPRLGSLSTKYHTYIVKWMLKGFIKLTSINPYMLHI